MSRTKERSRSQSQFNCFYPQIFNMKLFSVLTTWDIAEQTSYHSVLLMSLGWHVMYDSKTRYSVCHQSAQTDRQINKWNKNKHVFFIESCFFPLLFIIKTRITETFSILYLYFSLKSQQRAYNVHLSI